MNLKEKKPKMIWEKKKENKKYDLVDLASQRQPKWSIKKMALL